MSASVRVFDRGLYPRAALEIAAARFADICTIQLDDDVAGTRAAVNLPTGASEDVVREFCNLALATAIEVRLGMGSGSP